MTAAELHKAEREYERAAAKAEELRQARNALIQRAIDEEGWTHQAIGEATGLSRGRISQIKAGTAA